MRHLPAWFIYIRGFVEADTHNVLFLSGWQLLRGRLKLGRKVHGGEILEGRPGRVLELRPGQQVFEHHGLNVLRYLCARISHDRWHSDHPSGLRQVRRRNDMQRGWGSSGLSRRFIQCGWQRDMHKVRSRQKV
jgi:hypothetical protein